MGVVFGSQKNVTDYTSNDIVQNHTDQGKILPAHASPDQQK